MASSEIGKNLNASKALVATVLGWKCCCDIELFYSSDYTWIGSGFAGKGETGIRFDIEYTSKILNTRRNSIRVVVSGREQSHEVISYVRDRQDFSIELRGFFATSDSEREGILRNQIRILIGGHAEIKRMFKNYPFGLSYMPVVLERYRENPPRRILEWGPGRSTIFFAELFPEASIEGVEHDAHWFSRCRHIEALFPGRVSIAHRNLQIAPGKAEAYVSYPLYSPDRKFDLIFIDGRLRADCIAVAKLVLEKGGAVLVHDAHRENYAPAFRLYKKCGVVCNTAVLEM